MADLTWDERDDSNYVDERDSMTLQEYQNLAMRTSSGLPSSSFHQTDEKRKMVAGLGLAGEAGEVADLIKKEFGHGHPENREKIKDELGDIFWYLTEIATAYGLSLAEIAQHNVEKLAKRYPKGFSAEASINRVENQPSA